jgi:magnesium-transporting ATPase (P-type)
MKINTAHRMDKLSWVFENLLNFIGGCILTLLAYLAEIKGSIHVMWIMMVFDLFIGLRKSYKIDKAAFKMEKFRNWLSFVLLSTAVIGFVFAIEREMVGMEHPRVYNGFTILITGFVLSSIMRNAEAITKKYIFTALLDFINERVRKFTGIDLKQYEKKSK